MLSLGFSYGPVDGTLGAINSAGTYTLVGSGYKTSGGVQGAYAFSGSLTSITGFSSTPLITTGGDPNSYTFDTNYSGGGPVIPLYNGTVAVGYILSYHGEYWCNAGNSCSNANSGGTPNFYSGLGLAFSSNGTTFTKMGQVVQPYPTRASIFSANTNLEIGGGALMVGDINGNDIPNFASLSDKSGAYIYIFFSDEDTSNTVSPCNVSGVHCVGVARASYNAVVTAATGGQHAQFPTLFQKYYQGSFSQPATSSGNDQTTNSGHFTAIIAAAAPLYPSVVYLTNIGQFLITYSTGNNQINFQTGTSLLSFSGAIASLQINESGWTLLEPSLLGESGDPLTSNGSPYVYYVKANNWATQNWRSASYVSRQLNF
jgi:hypothetical protein